MNADSKKNKEFLIRFPFLPAIFNESMEPHGSWRRGLDKILTDAVHTRNIIDDLTIKVERADGDLMYYKAKNTGLGEASCLFSTKKDSEGQLGREGVYFFAIDGNNKIINRLNWPRNEKEARDSHQIYGYHVLWKNKSGDIYTNPLWDRVKYLVLVKVSTWHEDTKNDDAFSGRFGQFIERRLCVTIYREPKQGFEKLQKGACIYENLYLTSGILVEGVLRKDLDYIAINGMLSELTKLFQEEVFLKGLREMYDKFSTRGGSATFGSVKMMAADMCGYYRIQLEDSSSWISFQQHDSSKRMSAIGMEGTLPQLRNLVKTVVKKWNENPEARLAFQSDGKISVM